MIAAGVSTALAYGCLAGVSLRLSVIDARERRLPNRLTLGLLLAITVLLALAAVLAHDVARLGVALACGAGYFLAFACFALVRPGALGGGDVKLAPTMGIATGWMHLDAALIITPLALAVTTLLTLTRPGSDRTRHRPFAFGPILILAMWIGVLSGAVIRIVSGQCA